MAATPCRANLTGYCLFNSHARAGYRRSLARGSDDYLAKHHAAFFAALEVDGAGQFFVTIESAAGDAGDFLVVDDGLAVQDYRDHPADEGDVVRLPFAGLARRLRRRSEKTVDSAHALTRGIAGGIGFDLDFVTAAQIHAAIGIGA